MTNRCLADISLAGRLGVGVSGATWAPSCPLVVGFVQIFRWCPYWSVTRATGSKHRGLWARSRVLWLTPQTGRCSMAPSHSWSAVQTRMKRSITTVQTAWDQDGASSHRHVHSMPVVTEVNRINIDLLWNAAERFKIQKWNSLFF